MGQIKIKILPSGFEIQRTRHQKFKIGGISGPLKGHLSTKILKKIKNIKKILPSCHDKFYEVLSCLPLMCNDNTNGRKRALTFTGN